MNDDVGNTMVEKKELDQIACLGENGQSLTALKFQFFETEQTSRGVRMRLGAVCFELKSGEALRQIDDGCFELIGRGELITVCPDTSSEASIREDIPLCHYEELARQENRRREVLHETKLTENDTDHASRPSSRYPKV